MTSKRPRATNSYLEVSDSDSPLELFSDEEFTETKKKATKAKKAKGDKEVDKPAKAKLAAKKSPAKKTPTKKASAGGKKATKSSGKAKVSKPKVIREVLGDEDEIIRGFEDDDDEDGVVVQREARSLGEIKMEELTEVSAMPAIDVAKRIEKVILSCIESVLSGKGFEFQIPSRAASNQVYIPSLDRIALKKSKMSQRAFVNAREVQKATFTTRVLELVHNILNKGIHITKRDLFYTDVKLFQKQENSDSILDDVACMLGCTRTSLNVVASEKGLVVGRLKFKEDGDEIDCSKMGVGGKGIPPMIDRVTDLRSDAEFILLVEKDAAFMRLSEDRFYNKEKCIVVTAKGQPDVATRMFLKRLREELQLPVLALVDSDPYGLKILSVYMSGSKNMSYDSASLTCPDIKWLGVRPSDLNRYNIPKECRLKMTDADKKTGEAMLQEDFIKKNPQWVKELELMLKTGEKAEIQALSNFGFQFLTEVYLPEKIKKKDWV